MASPDLAPDPSSRPLARVGRHGLIYAAGMLISRAVAFVMLPVYTRYLTPGDYGTLQLIGVTVEVISIVAGSRLGIGLFHFYHKHDDPQRRRETVATALVLMVATYAVVTSVTFILAAPLARLVFGPQNDPDLIRIAAAILGFESLLMVPMAYLQVRERSGLFVAINTVKLVIQLSLNILFVVVMQLGVKGPLYSTLISYVLIGGVVTIMLIREVGLVVSREAARDLLRFGVPFVATQVGSFICTYGDRFFLARAANVGTVGIYGLAYQFGFLLHYVGLAPFQGGWDPIRFEIAKRDDRNELYARGFVYFNLVYITIAVGMALYVHDFIRVMSAPSFHSASDIVPVILLAYIVHGWTEQTQLGLMVAEKTERITWANWGGAIVALITYALLIPPFGGMGAAVATLIAFGARLWMIYVMSQKLWPVHYRWAPVIKQLTLAVVIVVAALLLPPYDLMVSLVARTVLLAVYCAGVWFVILTDADRQFVLRMLRGYKNWFPILPRQSA